MTTGCGAGSSVGASVGGTAVAGSVDASVGGTAVSAAAGGWVSGGMGTAVLGDTAVDDVVGVGVAAREQAETITANMNNANKCQLRFKTTLLYGFPMRKLRPRLDDTSRKCQNRLAWPRLAVLPQQTTALT